MKIYVYGTNKDDKGKQLEILTASFLESLGYTTTRNVIGSGGNEIDVVASKKECIGGLIKVIGVDFIWLIHLKYKYSYF